MPGTELERYQDDERALLGEIAVRYSDPEVVSEEIMRSILSASTLDDLFAIAGTTGARDVLNVPLTITDYALHQSEHKSGAGVYALISATRADTGESLKITCGARNVMAQLVVAGREGFLPLEAGIVEAGKDTVNGGRPMWLVRHRELPNGANN